MQRGKYQKLSTLHGQQNITLLGEEKGCVWSWLLGEEEGVTIVAR